MKLGRKSVLVVGLAVAVALFVVFAALYTIHMGHRSEHNPLLHHIDTAKPQISAHADAPPLTIEPESDLSRLEDLQLPTATLDDLLSKGFPLMSNPRKAAYEQTAAQTIEEVAADLGNIMTLGYCTLDMDTDAGGNDILRYRGRISHHIKVLRLIEEGRKNPGQVSRALYAVIEDGLLVYESASKTWKSEWRKWTTGERPSPVISDKDEYYNQHRHYEDPVLEFERLHDAVYSSFYILANIGAMDGKLLARWIKQDKPRQYSCRDMDIWLVDVYYHQAHVPPDAAKSYAELTAEAQISGQLIKQSKWNALWDRHHPLLKAQKVNLADIETIEVLRIPPYLPESIPNGLKERIIESFLEHTSEK